ncbi:MULTISPECIES: LPS translocon maturation chaperone LptM [Aeromonas]|jgi:predicted small lipoprotein YifL|uniref:LPS translocon maturation chaperone LptM n=1 Tax=Aeromonas TaxID=642 RepID=UPI000D6524E6|nr:MULTISPECIES: lipoprotein [Aeromonas]MDX7710009.1 lipoprotein [Aeromonas caviae]QXB97293.1 lipoprotein [Aeromonas sp. FDAARGOS 1406]WAF60556.1 lipoprotein [Aeromonas caviae]WAF64616.1 lipoprotein [Aeromonas caviae]WAF81443.1 lipoprotein [Aeromonas caviae]
MITQFTKCLFAASLSLGLAACGLTGPLYMPPAEQPAPAEQTQPMTESTPQAASPATATPASEAAPQ